MSGAPGEGPTNATHIFCRTCHGWWPRPNGCPHHGGAPGDEMHLADDEGDQVGATFDPDKGYAVVMSGAPGEGLGDYSTLSAHEKHLMGAPGEGTRIATPEFDANTTPGHAAREGQPRRFFLELPLRRGEGTTLEDAETVAGAIEAAELDERSLDAARAAFTRLLARAEAAEAERDKARLLLEAEKEISAGAIQAMRAAERQRDTALESAAWNDAQREAAEAELRKALEAAMEAAKQDEANQAKVTELEAALERLRDLAPAAVYEVVDRQEP